MDDYAKTNKTPRIDVIRDKIARDLGCTLINVTYVVGRQKSILYFYSKGGKTLILQAWDSLDAWEIYTPIIEANQVDKTWEVLREYLTPDEPMPY